MSEPARARPHALQEGRGVPRYVQLAMLFRRKISSGEWVNEAQIPTVDDLAAEHVVARATIRMALGLLEHEGLIERYRAKGTFVTYKPREQLWCEVETDWSGLLRSREGAVIEVLSEQTGQEPPTSLHPVGERAKSYLLLRRRHSRDGEPFLVANVYISEKLVSRIPPELLHTKSALSLLADVRGLEISDVRQTLTIGAADLAIAQELNIPLNAPVAYVHRSAVDSRGELILVSDGVYRGDVVRLDMRLK